MTVLENEWECNETNFTGEREIALTFSPKLSHPKPYRGSSRPPGYQRGEIKSGRGWAPGKLFSETTSETGPRAPTALRIGEKATPQDGKTARLCSKEVHEANSISQVFQGLRRSLNRAFRCAFISVGWRACRNSTAHHLGVGISPFMALCRTRGTSSTWKGYCSATQFRHSQTALQCRDLGPPSPQGGGAASRNSRGKPGPSRPTAAAAAAAASGAGKQARRQAREGGTWQAATAAAGASGPGGVLGASAQRRTGGRPGLSEVRRRHRPPKGDKRTWLQLTFATWGAGQAAPVRIRRREEKDARTKKEKRRPEGKRDAAPVWAHPPPPRAARSTAAPEALRANRRKRMGSRLRVEGASGPGTRQRLPGSEPQAPSAEEYCSQVPRFEAPRPWLCAEPPPPLATWQDLRESGSSLSSPKREEGNMPVQGRCERGFQPLLFPRAITISLPLAPRAFPLDESWACRPSPPLVGLGCFRLMGGRSDASQILSVSKRCFRWKSQRTYNETMAVATTADVKFILAAGEKLRKTWA